MRWVTYGEPGVVVHEQCWTIKDDGLFMTYPATHSSHRHRSLIKFIGVRHDTCNMRASKLRRPAVAQSAVLTAIVGFHWARKQQPMGHLLHPDLQRKLAVFLAEASDRYFVYFKGHLRTVTALIGPDPLAWRTDCSTTAYRRGRKWGSVKR